MFWLGLAIGLVIGGNFGFLIASFLKINKKYPDGNDKPPIVRQTLGGLSKFRRVFLTLQHICLQYFAFRQAF